MTLTVMSPTRPSVLDWYWLNRLSVSAEKYWIGPIYFLLDCAFSIKNCTIVFLAGKFLFTSSDTVVVLFSNKMQPKTNHWNYFTIWNTVKNASGMVHWQWHSLPTKSTSGVNTRCKQRVSNIYNNKFSGATWLTRYILPLLQCKFCD